MPFLPALVLLLAPVAATDPRLLAIAAENVRHMTIEQRTTPREARRFRVLDAETRQPVPGARVVLVHDFHGKDDWVMAARTDAAGVATFKLATKYLHLLEARVVATDGYLSRDALHFEDDVRPPGVGRLTDDPVDIRLYKGPAVRMGLRVPADFRGTFVYRLGHPKYHFPFPPDFPAGQRVWWTDVVPGGETVVEEPPRLGGGGWNGHPVEVVARDGVELPVPEPGADAEGVAAWHLGVRTPDGPWGAVLHLVVIGTRAEALAEARAQWERHGNGKAGFVYDGWLRLVSPQAR